MSNRFSFLGGEQGAWRVIQMSTLCGEPLSNVARVNVVNGSSDASGENQWGLQGVVSNVRYATRDELNQLQKTQQGLGRPEAICAALIPIKKSAQWWALAQDERRDIMETTSRHTAIGLEYLPAIARRLHHSRDLGEPFDFITWFEFAPEHTDAFNDLLLRLRSSAEWQYVEREVDIRLELN